MIFLKILVRYNRASKFSESKKSSNFQEILNITKNSLNLSLQWPKYADFPVENINFNTNHIVKLSKNRKTHKKFIQNVL